MTSSPGKATVDGNSKGKQSANAKGLAGNGGGVTGWQDGCGIGSGLARPDVDGSVLRRRSWSALALPGSDSAAGTGAGNTKLSELIPRFLRLSALVAIELGSEARDGELPDMVGSLLRLGQRVDTDHLVSLQPASSPSAATTMSPSRLAQYNATREKNGLHANALRPS